MKTVEKLQSSYEKQRQLFEENKARKVSNLENQIKDLDRKILELTDLKKKLQLDLEKRLQSNFRSFEDFKNQAETQANSKS